MNKKQYKSLSNTGMLCCLQPLVYTHCFETLGTAKAEGAEFLSDLGCHISAVSGDQRETNFLLQRLSISIQHRNIRRHTSGWL